MGSVGGAVLLKKVAAAVAGRFWGIEDASGS